MVPCLSTSTSRSTASPDRTSATLNSISIIVSDDDSDEPSRMRFRVKKKRRKDKAGLGFWALRKIFKWWACLLLLPALALLFFEIFKTANEPKTTFYQTACLKLLPSEDIERLEFPLEQTTATPVKSLIYKMAESRQEVGDNAVIFEQMEAGGHNFNLFTGNQTLHERQESFKVQDTMVVHCGFYNDNGATFWFFQAFTECLPVCQMLGHRLFPQARYSIWVDSKSQFRRDPVGVFEALLWRTNSVIAISEHGARSCVYDEGKAIVRKHKATPEEVDRQLAQYHLDGFPEDARYDGHKALAEASVIVREHAPVTNLFMCLWFNEVVRFTSRDQLSFPYVLKQLGILHIHMFPVCTRRALVNSMGHKHKAKPLVRQAQTLMSF